MAPVGIRKGRRDKRAVPPSSKEAGRQAKGMGWTKEKEKVLDDGGREEGEEAWWTATEEQGRASRLRITLVAVAETTPL